MQQAHTAKTSAEREQWREVPGEPSTSRFRAPSALKKGPRATSAEPRETSAEQDLWRELPDEPSTSRSARQARSRKGLERPARN